MLQFTDSRKWGVLSYLDILEKNDVAFNYDGKTLSFPNSEAEKRASRIWYSLTGQQNIGVVA